MNHLFGGLILGFVLAVGSVWAAQDQPTAGQSSEDLLHRDEKSTVLILAGDGRGHVESVSVGVIIRGDGIILAAYRPIQEAREVQVRLSNGEVYDQVELVDSDERRDVAALHVPVLGLPAVAVATLVETAPGEKVLLLTNSGGSWTFCEGEVGAMRLADEVPGAGHGFRVVQFQAAIPPNSTGGVLLNSKGQMLGLLTCSLGAGGTAWAVPAESILGLAAQYKRTPLGSGKNLELPRAVSDAASAPREDANPYMALIKARTVEVSSRTVYFKAHMLEKELVNNAEFRHLGLNVVRGGHKADLAVEIDRPVLTYDFTYSVADGRTGTIVATGKVTAIDGPHAAPGMAKKLVLELEKARAVHATETEAK